MDSTSRMMYYSTHTARRRQREGRSRRNGQPQRYFPCWNLRQSVMAAGIFTIAFGCVILGFVSYELTKITRFLNTVDGITYNENESVTYYNKDWTAVDYSQIPRLIYLSRVENILYYLFIVILILLILSSGLLVRAALKSERNFFIVWMVAVAVTAIHGTAVTLFDCSVYGFHGENNIELLVWIAFVVSEIHCFRCLVSLYKMLGCQQNNAQNSNTHEISQTQGTDNPVFTIPMGDDGPPTPVLPPPYEKEPPKYSLYDVPPEPTCSSTENLPEDKPPDYAP